MAKYRVELTDEHFTICESDDALQSYLEIFELTVPLHVLLKMQPQQPLILRLDSKSERRLRLFRVDEVPAAANQLF